MTSRIGAVVSGEPAEPSPPDPVVSVEGGGSGTGAPGGPSGREPRHDRSLPSRVITSVLFIPVLVLLAWLGGIAYLLFTIAAIALMLGEFYDMTEQKGLSPHWKSGFLAALLLPLGLYSRLRAGRVEEWHVGGLLTLLLFAIFLAELRRGTGRQAAVNTSATLLGVLYVGWLGSHLAGLRELAPVLGHPYAWGMSFALLPFFLAWSCDTAAYAVGHAFGRRKLAPALSPKKSVEGAMGGLAASIAAGVIAHLWFAPYLTLLDAIVLGTLVGFFAQIGDLVESLFKRHAATKDSSELIPGHGGALDRFDSLLFAAPIVYYYLVFRTVMR
jgi:phosphatidate cytidylyltransferase